MLNFHCSRKTRTKSFKRLEIVVFSDATKSNKEKLIEERCLVRAEKTAKASSIQRLDL